MPDVQYVYIQTLAKCFLIIVNPFIILKISFLFSSIPFLFIGAVGLLMILNGVYDKYFDTLLKYFGG